MLDPDRLVVLALLGLLLALGGCLDDAGPDPQPTDEENNDRSDEEPRGQPLSCGEVMGGNEIHEHARIEVYLASEEPYDFSPERYQLAHRTIHFEAGERDAGGAIIHLHEQRPTLGCMLETLGWSIEHDRIVTDDGSTYDPRSAAAFEVFVNGRESSEGFDTPLRGEATYVLRFDSAASPSPCPQVREHDVHEHAALRVHLNSSEPWDFSPDRYQRQAPFVAFEDGREDADTARIHVHKARPSLSCLFRTIGWEVSQHRIEPDVGPVYQAGEDAPIEVLVNGEAADDGFQTLIQRAHTYEVWFNASEADEADG